MEKIGVKVTIDTAMSDGTLSENTHVDGVGVMWEQDHIRYIAYAGEGAASGLNQMIELWPGRLIVRSKTTGSEQESRMTFRVGQRLATDYQTPYGIVPMETDTKKMNVKRREDGCELELEYALFLERAFLQSCHMKIVVQAM